MDANLTALQLVLNGLSEPSSIGSMADRMRLQKAIYLTQVAGINLGYSYSWYLKGPYSTSLTRDYYQLTEEKEAGVEVAAGMQLNPAIQPHLERAKQLMAKPADVQLPMAHWYELLASLHYLVRSAGHTYEKACETLRQWKPHLQDHFEAGRSRLAAFGLM